MSLLFLHFDGMRLQYVQMQMQMQNGESREVWSNRFVNLSDSQLN
jgi:hypothetical protein